jgi:hypothetical protein
MYIPEPRAPHVCGPLLFIDPEDVIYPDLPNFFYCVYIDILEVEDWSTPSESSFGSDSDSGGNGILDSQIQGLSHPYPK